MTGLRSAGLVAPDQTFRNRQSSDPRIPFPDFCAHGGPNESLRLIPLQGMTGCGGFQRSCPTGGAANGIPLNEATPLFTVPVTVPPLTRASWIDAPTGPCIESHKTAAVVRNLPRPISSRLLSALRAPTASSIEPIVRPPTYPCERGGSSHQLT